MRMFHIVDKTTAQTAQHTSACVGEGSGHRGGDTYLGTAACPRTHTRRLHRRRRWTSLTHPPVMTSPRVFPPAARSEVGGAPRLVVVGPVGATLRVER